MLYFQCHLHTITVQYFTPQKFIYLQLLVSVKVECWTDNVCNTQPTLAPFGTKLGTTWSFSEVFCTAVPSCNGLYEKIHVWCSISMYCT